MSKKVNVPQHQIVLDWHEGAKRPDLTVTAGHLRYVYGVRKAPLFCTTCGERLTFNSDALASLPDDQKVALSIVHHCTPDEQPGDLGPHRLHIEGARFYAAGEAPEIEEHFRRKTDSGNGIVT